MGAHSKNTFEALCTYFIIYAIAQGIMDAYEEAIETPYLYTKSGCSIELVGLIQTIDFLPWCVKFVWAIPSDTTDFFGFGHRRPYVILGLVLAAMAFSGLTLFNPKEFVWAYMICMITRNIGIALADCAIDGLSVDCDMDTEAGAIQGWMSLGRTIGTVLASVSAGYIAKDSYAMAILASAAMLFIPIPATVFIKEEWNDEKAYEDMIDTEAAKEVANAANRSHGAPEKVRGGTALAVVGSSSGEAEAGGVDEDGNPLLSPQASKKKLTRRKSFIAKVATAAGFDFEMLSELLLRRHVWLFLCYLSLSTMGVALANFSLTAWAEEERGFDISEIGILMSVMSVGCFLASLPMGYLFDYIPSKRSMMFMAAAACGLCNLALYFCETKMEVYLGLFGFGAAHGLIFVVQGSMARILADMRIAAAFFGIVNSICNLMHAFGTAFGGPIAGAFGLRANFLVGAAIDFLALLFCLVLPEAALRFSKEDAFEGKMKVLPHRLNLIHARERRTALNTELAELRAQPDGQGLAFAAKSPHVRLFDTSQGAGSKLVGTAYGDPRFATSTATAASASTEEAFAEDVISVVSPISSSAAAFAASTSPRLVLEHTHEVRRLLAQVPAYVPMAHLEASRGFGGGGGFGGEFGSAGGDGRVKAVSRRSIVERISDFVEGATTESARAPRPVPVAHRSAMSALLASVGASPARRPGKAVRRSSVAHALHVQGGGDGSGGAFDGGGNDDEFDDVGFEPPLPSSRSPVEQLQQSGAAPRTSPRASASSGSGGGGARIVRNPLAALGARTGGDEGESNSSDDTGDVTNEVPTPPQVPEEDGGEQGGVYGGGGEAEEEEEGEIEDERLAYPAAHPPPLAPRRSQPLPPPPALPPPPVPTLIVPAAPAALPLSPPPVSTSGATSAKAFAASRRARLDAMALSGDGRRGT